MGCKAELEYLCRQAGQWGQPRTIPEGEYEFTGRVKYYHKHEEVLVFFEVKYSLTRRRRRRIANTNPWWKRSNAHDEYYEVVENYTEWDTEDRFIEVYIPEEIIYECSSVQEG